MFEEQLEKAIGDVCGLTLLNAVYCKSKDKLSLLVAYPDGMILSSVQKTKIKEMCKQIASTFVTNVDVSLKKAFADNDLVEHTTKSVVQNNFPLLFASIKSVSSVCKNDKIVIVINVSDDLSEYIVSKGVERKISCEIEKVFNKKCSVEFLFCESETDNALIQDEYEPVNLVQERHIKVFNKEKYVGDEIVGEPVYISDIVSPREEVAICGAIKFISLHEFKTKTGKERHIAKFAIKDPTGEMNCVMFVSETTKPKIEKLDKGIEVLVFGECENSRFGGLETKVKSIMLCEVQKNFVEEIHFLAEPKRYKITKPEKINYFEQSSLFSQKKSYNNYVMNNDLVVFDLETTGLNFMESEIIEIGAIKIKKGGVISEKFSTYVKPTTKIPKEITDLTGITDDDVKVGSSLEDAIADFYKFTRGATLVGHNVSFDYGFINYYGRKVGYDFSKDPQQDTYKLAQEHVKGLKNYKLKTVAEHFGVDLKNAHRAYHDAFATAQVYLKLSEIV